MTGSPRWNAPVLLDGKHHQRGLFSCGNTELDDWIKKYATQSQAAGTARVFVATPVEDDSVIAGFYSLHLGALERSKGSRTAAHRAPDPIPAVVMGRLAIDAKFGGQGLGRALLRDALARTLLIAANAGAKIFLVHAKDETAKNFYVHHEFEPSPVDELTLMLLVQDIPGASL